ncbi:hypothetical protein Unana1_01592 [Umbelopsis nana]
MQYNKDGLLDFVLIISSVRRGPDDDLNLGIDNLTQTLSDNLSIAVKQTADDPDTDEHWTNAAKLAELCANTARDERTRDPLSKAGVIQSITEIMKQASKERVDYLIQALRSLGNLCFDHDENRKLVAESDVIPVIVRGLESKHPALVRTTCGALLNLSIDSDVIQEQVCECQGVRALMTLIEPAQMNHGEEAMVTTAAKLLTVLQVNEKALPQIAEEGGVSKLVDMVRYTWTVDKLEDMDLLEYLSEILQQVLLENETAQASAGKSLSFITLLDFLERAELPDDAGEEEEKQFGRICKSFVKAIVGVSLADQHCIDLVQQHHLEVPLLRLLQKTEDLRVQHAVVSILKNLSLPISYERFINPILLEQNKQSVGAAGTIQIVSEYLDSSKDMLKPVQFAVIGILKLLSIGDVFNATQIVIPERHIEGGSSGISPLTRVIEFIERVDDVAARSEATRVLVNLIKTVWSQEHASSSLLKERLCSLKTVTALTALVRSSQFSILQNEGIISLTLLFTYAGNADNNEPIKTALDAFVAPEEPLSHVTEESSESQSQEPEKAIPNLLQVLLRIIVENEAKTPDEVRCNACVLLERALLSAKKVQSDNFGIMSEQVSQQLNDADKSRFSGSLQERISQLRLAIE